MPTAQTLLASVPHTPVRSSVVPLLCGLQTLPFHLRIVPYCRPRPRRCWRLPPTRRRGCTSLPLLCGLQTLPFHLRIVPSHPTAQTLLASVPHMPKRSSVVPLLCALQTLPFHLRIVPSSPYGPDVAGACPPHRCEARARAAALRVPGAPVPFEDRAADRPRPRRCWRPSPTRRRDRPSCRCSAALQTLPFHLRIVPCIAHGPDVVGVCPPHVEE